MITFKQFLSEAISHDDLKAKVQSIIDGIGGMDAILGDDYSFAARIHLSKKDIKRYPDFKDVWDVKIKLRTSANPIAHMIDHDSDDERVQQALAKISPKDKYRALVKFGNALEKEGKVIGVKYIDKHGFTRQKKNNRSLNNVEAEYQDLMSLSQLSSNLPDGKDDYQEYIIFVFAAGGEADDEQKAEVKNAEAQYDAWKKKLVAKAKEVVASIKTVNGAEVAPGVKVKAVDFSKSDGGIDKFLDPSDHNKMVQHAGSVQKNFGFFATLSDGLRLEVMGHIVFEDGDKFVAEYYFYQLQDRENGINIYGNKMPKKTKKFNAADPVAVLKYIYPEMRDKYDVALLKAKQKKR